jgi:hypothetical protein
MRTNIYSVSKPYTGKFDLHCYVVPAMINKEYMPFLE